MFFNAAFTAIDNAIDSINKVTDNTKFQDMRKEIFLNIVSAVHLIADCEERIRSKLTPEDDEQIRAFLYINNQHMIKSLKCSIWKYLALCSL